MGSEKEQRLSAVNDLLSSGRLYIQPTVKTERAQVCDHWLDAAAYFLFGERPHRAAGGVK